MSKNKKMDHYNSNEQKFDHFGELVCSLGSLGVYHGNISNAFAEKS